MKALTLWQPWAALIGLGVKRCETRGWGTRYRGRLAIHAAKVFPQAARNACLEPAIRRHLEAAGWPLDEPGWFERGVVICHVELLDCILITRYVQEALRAAVAAPPRGRGTVEVALPRAPHHRNGHPYEIGVDELALGDFRLRRWMWVLGTPVPVRPPVPTRGAQGLFDWKPPR